MYFNGYVYGNGHSLWKLTDTTLNTPPPSNVNSVKKSNDKILIAPNPAHNNVSVSWNKMYENVQLSIVDLTGKIVLTGNVEAGEQSTEIALPELPTGVYLLNLKHNNGIITERLLIE